MQVPCQVLHAKIGGTVATTLLYARSGVQREKETRIPACSISLQTLTDQPCLWNNASRACLTHFMQSLKS